MKRCFWLCCAQQHACDNTAALGHTGEQLPEPDLFCPGSASPFPHSRQDPGKGTLRPSSSLSAQLGTWQPSLPQWCRSQLLHP